MLLHKLKLYRCCDTTLSWFQSYLCGRSQKVSIRGHLSESNEIICGVPQGSILGPFLFSMFINDLPLRMEHSSLSMYADDSTLNTNGKDQVSSWCEENGMTMNAEKTKAMLITTRQKRRFLPKTALDLFLQGERLSAVNIEELLWVLIDSNLSWKPDIQKVKKLVASNLALLRRIKQFLPLHARRTFYMAFIQTNLDYCSIIWGKSCHTDTLYKLQKRAVRLILDVPATTPTHDLFLKL